MTIVDNIITQLTFVKRWRPVCSHQKKKKREINTWGHIYTIQLDWGTPFTMYTYIKSSQYTLQISYNSISHLYLNKGKHLTILGNTILFFMRQSYLHSLWLKCASRL